MDVFKEVHSAKGPSLFLLSEWGKANPDLTAGFTGRNGGVSGGQWRSLNVGLHVGDDAAVVVANRQRLADAIDWPFEAWTCAEQVHGNKVYKVTSADKGKGKLSLDDVIPDCDAIMTNEPNVLLTSFYADCVPLYFYDPEHGAVALAHAGWRGTVRRIAEETIRAMEKAYGSKPEALMAAIGPAIDSCCYEVDGVVIEQVEKVIASLGLSAETADIVLQKSDNGKAHINLKEINRQIMIKAGILPIHIELTKWCTGCRRDLFFSHRMENGLTGRMASWIGIRER
ncbi:peptidoglycan editing factor PgeF [Paenibacillus harenae]|uniref:peptidoglycan editing factor PgeF n=1 Tax=Paenibacillus harenae TaxID=306543 RepID=UPI00278CDB72|nr:peptidoglycan editing factor PgeF [Paenibacillus harenae]MDQ0059415.1 YfiH family protein [Paenibacillus harenae]